jgi:hypothetical protein
MSKCSPNGYHNSNLNQKIKFEPNFKFYMLFGYCNAFQTMVNLFVLTWSSIRAHFAKYTHIHEKCAKKELQR